ncbi:IMS domain-containing protein [Microseira sp. BLCC-F43]|uniref:IMS domain-containing protein n=1 Tax=Microseira sp. BLCC-F43 TaxID=3153602 RepID=UPI0035B7300B
MRIPLDYYRILGLPIQASTEQLQQAYRDRVQQLPRREYSEIAILARKQLLDEAYGVLSDPEQRSAYDASFFTKTYASDSPQRTESPTTAAAASVEPNAYPEPPSIDISDEEFLGALLILQELGEYELVLHLGRSYLSSSSTEIETGRFGEPKIARADMVLTVALACLELGREQWQQRRYEDAAATLDGGQELLLREGLFAGVRGEIQSDLYKLRPYRILELLALPLEETQERRKGVLLLQEMLVERGGIDGAGNDQSGLNKENFLRFIQQLRVYLTSAEQQALFEEEARRPSAVATYLAVYALLARGFTQRQPELIGRAKVLLMRLGKRQDVYLEQSICALLLGQTDEASRALELSGEYEALAFIREHSQGAPDLLPGLCLYSERWLQEEVFPHFRDLAEQQVSLKDYFADDRVQTALESLPKDTEATNQWEAIATDRISTPAASPSTTQAEREAIERLKSQMQRTQALIESRLSTQIGANIKTDLPRTSSTPLSGSGEATLSALLGKAGASMPPTPLPTAERVANGSIGAANQTETYPGEGMPASSVGAPIRESVTFAPGASLRQPTPPGGATTAALQHRPGGSSTRRGRRGRTNRWLKQKLENLSRGWRNLVSPAANSSKAAKQKRLILLLGGVLGIGVLLFLLIQAIGALNRNLQQARSPVKREQLEVSLDKSLLEPSAIARDRLTAPGPITEEVAQQVIQTWLDRKKEAFGSNHEIERLAQILVNPALARWEAIARTARRNNWHREFEHTIENNSIQIPQGDANQAKVEAQVREVAKHYRGERLVQRESYDSNLRVQYDLVRQNGRWFIRDMTVLK